MVKNLLELDRMENFKMSIFYLLILVVISLYLICMIEKVDLLA
nr:MAG TPA: hypothetical protein [Caudoviricetes sp.]